MADAPRDYKKEYREYQGKPEQIKHRSSRNHARLMMKKKFGKKKIAGKDIDHKDGNPMRSTYKNLAITSVHYNRAKH
jgi:hypothetical protein